MASLLDAGKCSRQAAREEEGRKEEGRRRNAGRR